MHAPNEKFHLPNLERGIATCIHFYADLRTPAVIVDFHCHAGRGEP